MQKITTFLTFKHQAEEAVRFYTSLFKNSKIGHITRYGEEVPALKDTVMSVTFELNGQEFMALNGGPHFAFSEGISLFVSCETQQEVDDLWEKLSYGGEKGQCGWLKDRFGVSWQIIPVTLGRMLQDTDAEKVQKVMQAMMQMNKIDVKTLEQAYAA